MAQVIAFPWVRFSGRLAVNEERRVGCVSCVVFSVKFTSSWCLREMSCHICLWMRMLHARSIAYELWFSCRQSNRCWRNSAGNQNISTPVISEKREGDWVKLMWLQYQQLPCCIFIGCIFRLEDVMITCCVCLFFSRLDTPAGHDTGGVVKSSFHLWFRRSRPKSDLPTSQLMTY